LTGDSRQFILRVKENSKAVYETFWIIKRRRAAGILFLFYLCVLNVDLVLKSTRTIPKN
jgi:hypothetical protein